MARWRATYKTFECLSCDRSWRDTYWQPIDSVAYLEEMAGPQGNQTAQSNVAKLTCTCDNPHVRIRPYSGSGSASDSVAQVRASQRAVIYQFPDGTWAAPGSNDPNDPVAQTSIRDGAVRREFYHIRDMHDFQRGLRKNGNDDFTGRNDVMDFDEINLRHRDTNTIDMDALHLRESRLRDAYEMVGGHAGRYEEVIREYRKRGWV
jgi:hypothetical protein